MISAALPLLAKTRPPAAMASDGQGLRFANQHADVDTLNHSKLVTYMKFQIFMKALICFPWEEDEGTAEKGREGVGNRRSSRCIPEFHWLRMDKDCV